MKTSKKTKKSESPAQTLARWFADSSDRHITEVLRHYGRYAGNGPRITVDGITFEKVVFADCPNLEHLGSGYCVVELDGDGGAA